jgi:hypothetical protein
LRFRSRFWKSLHEALGTNLKLSSAYHPQTDGKNDSVAGGSIESLCTWARWNLG